VSRAAVFLDKDGTLVENVPRNVDPARMTLMPGARALLPRLTAAGYALVVVTNQDGVAFGHFREDALRTVESRIGELLSDVGVKLAGFLYCPHHPDATVNAYRVRCDCRKPRPGLLVRAMCRLDVDSRRSWMVGDILDDVEAGTRAGCRTIFFDNGGETEWRLSDLRIPTARVTRLVDVADVVLGTGASQ
jgi:histidinol-phosphate phosphatase family protein